MTGSPWLPPSLLVKLDTDLDPGVASPTRQSAGDAVAYWVEKTIGQLTNTVISGLYPSGSARPVTFAPRFLLYLRIKHLITQLPARLNTGPVASDYPDGIRTR